jgi:hypothetical protein
MDSNTPEAFTSDVRGRPYPPGGPTLADRLLVGAIDLHHHGYPEMSLATLSRADDADEFRMSRAAGMAAVVLKSHMWPTVGRAYLLSQMAPGIEIIPSITLNTVAGGFNPAAVESAALQGARVMFMPTWSAANDIERGGFSSVIGQYIPRLTRQTIGSGLRAIGPSGKVLPEVLECLSVAAEHGMLLCTAHISPVESIALAQAARDAGIDEIVFSHPHAKSVGATPEHIRDMAQLGACCEFCIISMLPAYGGTSIKTVLDVLAELPPERVVITTDHFYEFYPPGAEMMRMIIGSLLHAGVSEKDVAQIFRGNPQRLLAKSRARHPPAPQ